MQQLCVIYSAECPRVVYLHDCTSTTLYLFLLAPRERITALHCTCSTLFCHNRFVLLKNVRMQKGKATTLMAYSVYHAVLKILLQSVLFSQRVIVVQAYSEKSKHLSYPDYFTYLVCQHQGCVQRGPDDRGSTVPVSQGRTSPRKFPPGEVNILRTHSPPGVNILGKNLPH